MSQAMPSYIQRRLLRCKMLVGSTQTRELHLLDAGYAMGSLNKILVRIMYVCLEKTSMEGSASSEKSLIQCSRILVK